MKIIISTSNKRKRQWFEKELQGISNIPVWSLDELSIEAEEVLENGNTCEDNAIIKTKAITQPNSIVIGEDGGLFVDALDGFPGLFTSRWMEGNEDEKSQQLVKLLGENKNRKAYFQSSLALLFPDGKVVTATGYMEGEITVQLKGEKGEGYSRLFIPENCDKTIAEIGYFEKVSNKHRLTALNKIIKKLKDDGTTIFNY
ncbi:non-canonical purine NTP pyrophosphatase [Viridibacillus arvi]|uniref:non-canonical purine NTP pyrophosphatase n=1 Tax=Viridibacillus arvi TaxID=263475 RepID=UPI0034D009FA